MRPFSLKITSILVLLILLAAVSPANAAQTAHTTEPLALRDCRFTIGDSTLNRSTEAKCGELSVPENPSLSDGRRVNLHIQVLPALDTTAKGLPVFHLEGGPGGAAIQSFGLSWYDAFAGVRQTHHSWTSVGLGSLARSSVMSPAPLP